MMKIMLLNSSIDTTRHEIPFHISELRSVVCKPFSMAADFLLDLMLEMESIKVEVKCLSISEALCTVLLLQSSVCRQF